MRPKSPCLRVPFTLAATAVAFGAAIVLAAGCSSSPSSTDQTEDDEGQALTSAVSMVDTLKFAMKAGMTCDDDLITAGAIAMAESSLIPNNMASNGPTKGCPSGSSDYGLWQIDTCYHPKYTAACLRQPDCNAKAMVEVSDSGSDWTPWASFKSGRYKKYVKSATTAFQTVCSDSNGGSSDGANGNASDGGVTSGGPPASNGGNAPNYGGAVSCAGVPDGLFCGDDWGMGGDPGALYQCAGGKVVGQPTVCGQGCGMRIMDNRDICFNPSCANLADGAYCGDDGIVGERNTLFRCKNGAITSAIPCPGNCMANQPEGSDDACQ